jgi:hypothetical protein
MKKYLVGLIVAAAAVGAWKQDAVTEWWETRSMTAEEQQEWRDNREEEDLIENELDELENELEDDEASGSKELDELEATE